MGLDVYVYKCKAPISDIRASYDSDDIDAPDALQEKLEEVSALHPKHYFKRGYFRSSYNSGGINSVLRRMLDSGHELYWVFGDPQDYIVTPDWHACLDRARSLLAEYHEAAAKSAGIDVMRFEANAFSHPSELVGSEKQALDVFLRERARESPCDHYSNRDGSFLLRDRVLRVRGVIPGVHESFAGAGMPCCYLVVEEDPNPDGDFYEQAIEIVVETIEWVLAQPDPASYILHWSS
jgi:hypothetical protein